jgi:hypothetical protein
MIEHPQFESVQSGLTSVLTGVTGFFQLSAEAVVVGGGGILQ